MEGNTQARTENDSDGMRTAEMREKKRGLKTSWDRRAAYGDNAQPLYGHKGAKFFFISLPRGQRNEREMRV